MKRRNGSTANLELLQNRDDDVNAPSNDATRCLSCRKLGLEDSGDDVVWHWRWADGLISTMPRGLRPQLCIPCARAATLDEGDKRESYER